MTKKLLYVFVFILTSLMVNAQNSVLEFDGVNARVKYDNDATLDIANGATNYTIEAWVKPTSTSIHNKVIVKRWFQFAITMFQDANKRFYFTHYDNSNSTTFVNSTNNALVIGQWNHIVVICNATDDTIKLYANGVDVTSGSPTALALSTPTGDANFYVGYGGAGTVPFAFIDKVRVKKTAETIGSLQANVTDADYTTDTDTAILMNFNEGSGTTTINSASSVDANLQCVGGCAELPTWHVLSSTLATSNAEFTNFSISPNPANSIITIQSQENITKFQISNVLGKIVMAKNNNSNSLSNTITISSLTSGVYFLTIQTEKGKGTKKIIIQ